MASSRLALKQVLQSVLPSIDFHDEELEYMKNTLEGSGSATTAAESWKQMLTSRSAAYDDASLDDLCAAIFKLRNSQDTKPQDSPVDGLREWLKELRLDAYRSKIEEWCISQDVKDLNGLRQKSEALLDSVDFKKCEVTRVKRDAANHPEGYTQFQKLLSQCKTFGDPPYAIMEQLGSGATAQVFRCLRFQENTGRPEEYAVKIFDLKRLRIHADYETITQKLMSEISISFSLQHRNIASQYDVIHDSGDEKLYLVMELVRGGDLIDYINSVKVMTEEVACDIFLQLVDALQCMHEAKIVHRDLKPENILVDTSFPNHPKAKIADFGASKLFDDGYSVLKTKTGTKEYWAPEVQDRDEKSYTKMVDLWSLGVVLYVMLMGCYPFNDDKNVKEGGETMAEKIKQGKFKINRCISREAKDLIQNLIKPNPDERLSLEQCLSHPWTKKFAQNTTAFSRKNGADDCEESICLPTDVTDVKQFRTDLSIFTIAWKFAATLRGKREVVVRWIREGPPPSAEALEMARLELQNILRKHFEGFSPPPRIQAR